MIDYWATKTASEFHLDDSFARLLLGPIGCGKSVAGLMEIPRRAAEQEAAKDGIRYTRAAIIRSTYPELKQTTIKTWQDWMPQKYYGRIKYDSPITHLIRAGDVHLEVLFLPLGCDEDVQKLKSLELTFIYFNELQYISEFLFEEALERVNRYPPKKMGCGITWTGVIADTNPPDTDHWIYRRFEMDRPSNHKIFKYEPAVIKVEKVQEGVDHSYSLDGTAYVENGDADYTRCQQAGGRYWLNLVESHTDDTINVSYMGNYGAIRKNKRVFPEYNDRLHLNDSIIYSPLLKLDLAWDFGRTPALIVSQFTLKGQFFVLNELCGEDINVDSFVGDVALPWLSEKFPGWQKRYDSVGDPAGAFGNQVNETTCFEILKKHGINTRPAVSNLFMPRKEAVSFFLRKLVDGAPCFQIHSNCVTTRKGFNGDYYYPKILIRSDERFREEPDKNYASHPHDALQYRAMEYKKMFDKPKIQSDTKLMGSIIS
jgi:hypothetical protein